jgi:hypothetical protein
LFLLQVLYTGFGVHPSFCPLVTSRLKRPGHEANSSARTSAEVKNILTIYIRIQDSSLSSRRLRKNDEFWKTIDAGAIVYIGFV